MNREVIIQSICMHLRRCPACDYDVSAARNVICPECGIDLTTAAAKATHEVIVTIIRLHLKRCTKCRCDMRTSGSAVCPDCGRDLAPEAEKIASSRINFDRPRWRRAAFLAMFPSAVLFLWILVRMPRFRGFSSGALWSMPSFIGPTLLNLILIGLAYRWLARRKSTPEFLAAYLITSWLWPLLSFPGWYAFL